VSTLTGLVARLPYVTRLAGTQYCDGYRWSRMTIQDLDDPTWMDTWKCHNHARWQFEALPLRKRVAYAQAGSGVYCWQHLLIQLQLNADEEARYREGIAKLQAA
jgi:hypothetical protein